MMILDNVCGLIPSEIANTIGTVYNILLIAVPVMVVLFGVIDFVKAVASGKADDISKNTSTFIKRLITGIIVFFVLALVKLVVNLVQTDNTNGVADCLNSIFGNNSSNN